MARVNVDILGISDLKWTGMGEFNSDDHIHPRSLQICLPDTSQVCGLFSIRTFSSLVHITIITAFVHRASYLSCLPVLNMCSFPLYLGNNLKTFSRSTRFLMSRACLPLHSWLVPVSLSPSCFGHIPCWATCSPSQDWPVPTYSFSLKLSLTWQCQTDLSV